MSTPTVSSPAHNSGMDTLPAENLASHASAGGDTSPAAQIRNLSLRYGSQVVLQNLDFTLPHGQVLGLLGRNGAGKTSLLESLLGLREAQQGTVELLGQPVAHLNDAARARIGYVPQKSNLFEGFTAAQLLTYFRSFYPRWNEAKVEGLMSRWDIPYHKTIGKLSGGQQQRLSIIRALAHEPDLLVLDEPVASLDPAGRRDFLRELVDQVLGMGTTVVFSTHILSDLERVAFNVAFLSQGRIALQAPLDDLMDELRMVSGSIPDIQAWLATSKSEVLRQSPQLAGQQRCLVRLGSTTVPMPSTLTVEQLNLEDLFLEITQ